MKKRKTEISRRRFLKFLAATPLSGVFGAVNPVQAETRRYGKLVDVVRCIGCKRCMSACKRWNNLEIERDDLVTDREIDLAANNWVVVNLLIDERNRSRKDYIHWACQHCIKPACVGVCPVKAITKLHEGPVVINEKKCIGCRYCFQACPYKVPRFDFKKRVMRKCHMCYNRIPLLNYMKPACVAACPVGALQFGHKADMIREAKRRVQRRGGANYIMGLTEAGGTDLVTILPTRPKDLNLVVAPKKIINQDLDKIRITAAGFMGASGLVGLMYLYAALTRETGKEDYDERE